MAAYAALLSLTITIERIPNPPNPSVKQPHIGNLTETITFLQEFLERNSNKLRSSKEIQDLESKITDLCNKTEDLVETIETSQILVESVGASVVGHTSEEISKLFLQHLNKLMKEFDAIKTKAELLDTSVHDIQRSKVIRPATSVFENHLEQATRHSKHESQRSTVIRPAKSAFQNHLEQVTRRSKHESQRSTVIRPARPVFENHLANQRSKHESQRFPVIRPARSRSVPRDLSTNDTIVEFEDYLANRRSKHERQRRSVPRDLGTNDTMVEFEDHLEHVTKKIANRRSKQLQILPITGMGGIGKTTLARNVFHDEYIEDEFEIRLWCTISQSYKMEDIFQSLLSQLDNVDNADKTSGKRESDLALKLYQSLMGGRYLVVLDDMWSVDVWLKIKTYFPDVNNSSRVIITTRDVKVSTSIVSSDEVYQLEPLDEAKSWGLLKQKVFGEEDCPSMLEDIGRKIAICCKGLPLALAVIGGQLFKSNMTRESWLSVADDVNSVLSSDGDNDCLKILSLSYDNLPIWLKPCFLFMGVFPEDHEVRVSKLMKLWVAEGLVKPIEGKCFEGTAIEYLTDLVDRNLLLVGKRGSRGNMVSCQIHDLLREVCLKEAYNKNFLCTRRSYGSPLQPRIVVPELRRNIVRERGDGSILYPSRSYTHGPGDDGYIIVFRNWKNMLFAVRYRILIFSTNYNFATLIKSLNDPQSLPMWRNIHTLIVSAPLTTSLFVPSPLIWEMTQLRHIEIERLILPDPPNDKAHVNEKGGFVLENLQTLLNVHNLKFSKEVLQRIPNVKKLKVTYTEEAPEGVESLNNYCIGDLDKLLKLESLSCSIGTNISAGAGCISFPSFLRKLTLDGGRIPWKDMTMLGSLTKLEVLRLRNHAFFGAEWRTIDDQFRELKSLHLQTICLERWKVKKGHFPKLESLIFCDFWGIEKISSSFGDALKLLSFEFCTTSLVNSAIKLKEAQADDGIYRLQVKASRTNSARHRVWKLEKHLEDFLKQTPQNISHELARQIEGLLNEADGAVKTMVKHKRETNIHLFNILEEVNSLHAKLQDIYPYTDLQAIYPEDRDEGPGENNEAPIVRQEHIVGFDDKASNCIRILKRRTSLLSDLSFIGKSGVGKTTMAKKIFNDPEIQLEFPIRIWCSSAHTLEKVYLEILKEFTEVGDSIRCQTSAELARTVNAYLQTKKFLIVLDEKRSSSKLDNISHSLPSTGKILIVDRVWESSILGFNRIGRLTDDESWLLLQLEVFGQPESPRELEYYGKLIVNLCDGLPLAIVVIGGILATKGNSTKDLPEMVNMWKNVAENVSKIQKGSIQSIISLSYNDMTSYPLRACFLYLGMFPKDYEIPAWKLTCMWISEGFIQHKNGLSLEEVAESYLDQFILRNLVTVDKRKRDGKVKTCRICAEIRKFCVIEATQEQENFFTEINEFRFTLESSCRVRIPDSDISSFEVKICNPLVRTLVCTSVEEIDPPAEYTALKLLRVLDVKPFKFTKFPSGMFELIHLSYIAISLNSVVLPVEFSELLNIRTLIVDTTHRTLEVKADIWKMKQLRHFKTNASANLSRPESGSTGGENIQTLGAISPESCTQVEFSCKARNLKKLGIRGRIDILLDSKNGSIDFLAKFESVEELKLANDVFPSLPHEGKLAYGLPPPHQFPPKLRSLTLTATFLDWTYMSVLGQLENLKVLKLKDEAFVGSTWETAAGGFPELEALYINRTDLVTWTASKDHFPRLRSLELKNCEELTQIPIELADVPSFQVLQLYGTNCAVAAAKEIRSRKEDGQTSNGNGFKLSIFAQVCSRTMINLDIEQP